MQLVEIRVRNYRSIEAEQRLPLADAMTLVGPNNSGKTNLLRAIQMLFTGYANVYRYSRQDDLTFGVGRNRTSITATFEGDAASDKTIFTDLDELHTLQGTQRSGNQISLTLYFTETNTPVYGLFPNVKRPTGTQGATYSRIHTNLVNKILGRFKIHYVPSAKSIDEIYSELLMPFLRRKVSNVIHAHIKDIEATLDDAAGALNTELHKANLTDFTARFKIPANSIEALVSGFDFVIADPHETPIHEKGMGIQTTALLAAFRWITQQEKEAGYEVIWLLEEPESYLHPHLAKNCNWILQHLSQDSSVIKTTHAMAFVPQDPSHLRGTTLAKSSRTELVEYKTYNEAVSAIRTALGIKFGDFYNLGDWNIFVEGPTDREIFKQVLALLPEDDYPLPLVRKAAIADFGGVKHLAGFLRATYQFIHTERPCVAVFDGDIAGERERQDLQQFFGQKHIPFESNRHFISVRSRFAIEGLFPDEWIKELHEDHAAWFSSFAVDATGELEPFSIRDDKKSNIQEKLLNRAELEEIIVDGHAWAARFVSVFSAIDAALASQQKALMKTKQEPI
jgi:predicted ATP-dependent endonuclease of OLD family